MWRRFPKETWYCTLEITDLSAQWCPKSFKESCQILVFIPCHASSLKKMKWGQRNNIHVVKRLLSTTLMLRRCFWDRVRCLTRVWRESSFALWTSESSFSMIRGNRNWKIVYIYFFFVLQRSLTGDWAHVAKCTYEYNVDKPQQISAFPWGLPSVLVSVPLWWYREGHWGAEKHGRGIQREVDKKQQARHWKYVCPSFQKAGCGFW